MQCSPRSRALTAPWALALLIGALSLTACLDDTTAPGPEIARPSLDLSTSNPGSWSSKAPALVSRHNHGGAVIRNGSGQDIMYIVGGWRSQSGIGTTFKRMDAYNAATNSWSQRADMPSKRAWPAVGALKGKLYVVGGKDDPGALTKTVYVYTPATNTWARKADLPIPTRGIARAIGEYLYLVTAETSPQRLYRYNPSTNSWARRADLPRNHGDGVADVINGKLYVAWGNSATVDVYDPNTNTWSLKLTMTTADWSPHLGTNAQFAIRNAQGVTFNGQLFLIGGTYKSFVFAYNPGTNSWSRKANMLSSRAYFAAGKIKNGAGVLQIFVTGGLQSHQADQGTFASEAFTQ